MNVDPITDEELARAEDDYAQGFIGGSWTHRVVPALFARIHADAVRLGTTVEQGL